MDGPVSFAFPEAPPDIWLRWLRAWRLVEQRMIESPALEALASSESAPFVREEFADMISAGLIPEIMRQAEAALRRGERLVRPRVELPVEYLAKLVRYVSRRARWLEQPGVSRALGVEFPPEAQGLRERLLADAVEVLRASGQERVEEGS